MRKRDIKLLGLSLIGTLLVLSLVFGGCGKKEDKGSNKNMSKDKVTKEETKKEQEEEKDLPIISNDGEEIIIEDTDVDLEKEETVTDETENDKGSSDSLDEETSNSEESDVTEKEPDGLQGSSEDPIELPFVPRQNM